MNPNPALADLRDIHLPPPISWWPPAPGWWILAALVLLIALGIFIWRRHRARNRWRQYALNELANLRAQHAAQSLTATRLIGDLSVLLRRVAISRFPREEVAALSGEAWLAFLDGTLGDPAGFLSPAGRLLSVGPYARESSIDTQSLEALLDLSERWLRKLPGGRK
jgi:HAMP domain-containing protein